MCSYLKTPLVCTIIAPHCGTQYIRLRRCFFILRNKLFKTNSNLSNLADQHGGEDQPPSQSSSDSATGGMGIKTMRRVYQSKHVIKTIQTSKQTGKMFCQT